MAHFRGTIRGARGEASRLGHKSSGLRVTAASWQGAVYVELYEKDGVDYARVSLGRHMGHGVSRELYDGPVGAQHKHVGVGHCPVCNHYGQDCEGEKQFAAA